MISLNLIHMSTYCFNVMVYHMLHHGEMLWHPVIARKLGIILEQYGSWNIQEIAVF